MRTSSLLAGVLGASVALGVTSPGWGADQSPPAPGGAAAKAPAPVGPQIEVCFVLDTTGSMSGLIEGAKAKIWSIANQIVSAKPAPRVKFGLIGYRDVGDDYVTKVYELTDDLDGIYAHLKEFSANGGGDTPESVNRALHEAVTMMQWSTNRDVLKIVFLVGDAPPHMDYKDDTKYPDVCQLAVKRDLVINTVQCGGDPETTRVWKEIAKLGEGQYAAIEQSGGMQAVSTPMDKEIAAKQTELNTTVLAYGDTKRQTQTLGRIAAQSGASAEAQADRAAVMSKAYAAAPASADVGGLVKGGTSAKPGRLLTSEGDMLDDLAAGKVKLESVKVDDLPPAMQKMSEAERREYVATLAKKRTDLQREVAELVKKRDAYIEQQRKESAAGAKKDGFDQKVMEMIQTQAQRKGISTTEK